MPPKMNTCDDYRAALTEAAAATTGASELPLELRSHLDACTSCGTAFREELQLFAAIDSGLRATANTEMPASLLPRVRVSLEAEVVAPSSWFANRFVLAGVATLILAVSAGVLISHRKSPGRAEPANLATTQSAPNLPPANSPPAVSASPANASPAVPSRAAGMAVQAARRAPAKGDRLPKVLVPRDQEALLVSYAAARTRGKGAPLVAANLNETGLSPLALAPIQIAQLDVKLLAEEESQ